MAQADAGEEVPVLQPAAALVPAADRRHDRSSRRTVQSVEPSSTTINSQFGSDWAMTLWTAFQMTWARLYVGRMIEKSGVMLLSGDPWVGPMSTERRSALATNQAGGGTDPIRPTVKPNRIGTGRAARTRATSL